MMTGEELYSRYVAQQDLLNNWACDPWDELPKSERKVWAAIAAEVLYVEADE